MADRKEKSAADDRTTGSAAGKITEVTATEGGKGVSGKIAEVTPTEGGKGASGKIAEVTQIEAGKGASGKITEVTQTEVGKGASGKIAEVTPTEAGKRTSGKIAEVKDAPARVLESMPEFVWLRPGDSISYLDEPYRFVIIRSGDLAELLVKDFPERNGVAYLRNIDSGVRVNWIPPDTDQARYCVELYERCGQSFAKRTVLASHTQIRDALSALPAPVR